MIAAPVASELAALEGLARDALAERWSRAFGVPAPKGSRALLLRLALGWQLQMVARYPVASDPKRLLRSLRRSAVPAAAGATLAPGTRLLREWQGRTHQVTVLFSGFEHEGRRYRSLSAIARHITGTAWSGPLFFGLRK